MVLPRVRLRKNFFLTVLITLFLWCIWALIFLLVPPEYFLMPAVFLVITFLGVLFPSSLVFANTRRGLLVAGGVVLFMLFNFLGFGNYLNLILLTGIIISFEYYFSKC